VKGALAGKVGVVTGGSKGIGRAVAGALVGAGAAVALLARPSAALIEAAEMLGPSALAVPCDMADSDQIDCAFAEVAKELGRIDMLIANAAICTLLKIEGADPKLIDREIATNLAGPIHSTRAALPHLRAVGGGDIVYVSSDSVRMPPPYLGVYAATKAGLETFAVAMRAELRAMGTRVTTLRSGYVASGGNLGADWDPATRDAFFAEMRSGGHTDFVGSPISPETMAQVLLTIVTAPRDVNLDLVEARGR
jgi:NAD(P)-dependent dehydrogenase (short-subunit alcohol dehydrogenase family)